MLAAWVGRARRPRVAALTSEGSNNDAGEHVGTSWSWGVLIGLPVAGICALVALVTVAFGLVMGLHDRKYGHSGLVGGDGGVTAGVGAVLLVLTLAVTGIAMWPWEAEYHQWRPVSGTLSDVRHASADDADQRTVLLLRGDVREFACGDEACALVVPGMSVVLSCKRSWQPWAGYDCVYMSAGTS